jgi:hypothetical protein
MDTVKVSAAEVFRKMTIGIEVKGLRKLRMRMMVAKLIFRIGAAVLGSKCSATISFEQ